MKFVLKKKMFLVGFKQNNAWHSKRNFQVTVWSKDRVLGRLETPIAQFQWIKVRNILSLGKHEVSRTRKKNWQTDKSCKLNKRFFVWHRVLGNVQRLRRAIRIKRTARVAAINLSRGRNNICAGRSNVTSKWRPAEWRCTGTCRSLPVRWKR